MVVMFHRTAMNILIRESLNPCSKGKQRAGLLVASGYNISSTYPNASLFYVFLLKASYLIDLMH